MSGLSLLGEFFTAGLRLFLQFISHPVTIGSIILMVCAVLLSFFLCFIGAMFPKYKDSLECCSLLVFLGGIVLLFGFLIYGIDADPFVTAWKEAWF